MYSENKTTRRRLTGSYLISLMSIMIVLFVLGLFASLLMYAGKLSEFVKENIGFEIVFKKGTKEADILQLQKELYDKDYVKSAEYISQKEASKRLSDDLGEDFMQWLGDMDNPLLPSIDVRFQSLYANNDSLAKIESRLMKKSIVKDIYYQKSLVESINSNISKIGTVLLVISLALLVMSVTLINHTVRLSIYAKRFLVRSMQLVGATRGFIMRPFVKSSVIQGFTGSVLALILHTLVMLGAKNSFPELSQLYDTKSLCLLYGFVILLGLLLTAGSTFFAVRKYLNVDVDKLYA